VCGVKLRDFLQVLRTRWRIVVASVLVVTGLAAAITYTATPMYTARAQFYFTAVPNSGPIDSSPYIVNPGDLATFVAVLRAPEVLTALQEQPGVDTDSGFSASASVGETTSIVSISVTSADPNLAKDVANGYGQALAAAAPVFSQQVKSSGWDLEARPVTAAGVPSTPSSPDPVRNLALGALAGLLLGIGIAFVRHTLDTKVRTEIDIRAFTPRPMLGELPMDRTKNEEVTLERDPHGGYAEAVRRLRTNLMFVDVTTGRHSFIVTSAMPGEGKTTTTVNLAMAMATTGGRVLLVDGDLRNPSVAKSMGLEGGAGLTTVLLGQAGIDDVIQRWRDTSLYVLTAGAIPPNPSELLGSEPMRELFDKLANEFDFILIDSPPVVPVVDAVLLDRLAGGTLLVVASHRTKKRDLASAVKQLDTVGAKLSGVALNFVPVNESDARRYGYYRFTGGNPSADGSSALVPPSEMKSRGRLRGKQRADSKGRRAARRTDA
jgi:capsular exopolysaccharide synthesis family protein